VAFTTPRVTDARVISIQGRIDAAKVIEFEQQFAGTLRIRRIVLDLSAATGVPPRTLTMLRGALRRVVHGGASLAIIGANQAVRSAIESCALDGVEFHRTASTALAGRSPERVFIPSTRLAAPAARLHSTGA
jgi:anti-anti-sigma regulatory factor